MNYSNMIEEKSLKKTFIVATLVSTLVGTFTASMALADKIQEKRDKRKQNATDGKQDNEIKQLEEKLKKLGIESGTGNNKVKGEGKAQRSRSSSRSSSRRRRRRHDDEYDDDAAYFAHSARRSRAMIEQTYQDQVTRMGQGYAHGDVITENRLQAQIIQLQQTVISVLQDALYNGRGLTEGDLQRLLVAQQAAREGSLDALEGRYSHMLPDQRAPRKQLPEYYHDEPPQRLLEEAPAPLPRQRTFPVRHVPSHSLPPPRRAESLPAPHSGIFCRYSEALQHSSRQLSPAFDPSADSRCSSCGQTLPLDSRDVWVFSTEVPTDAGGRQKVRECRMPARFVIKSHTPDARFACVLCNEHRDVDCICRSVEALVKHLAAEHTPEELEWDADLVSLRSNTSAVGRELVLA
ncbi:hypothetical protein LTR36_007129 [Oleoguttula mirabilis]|uniref:Uncharacterized protein n=1 Tax=Oleoguttula mirabilis TaxID=1507867 RepID=A0AAV9JB47_9PEZI|nr:hypothetical protein LTR36_007129 [Oleoguttula mirabilis]